MLALLVQGPHVEEQGSKLRSTINRSGNLPGTARVHCNVSETRVKAWEVGGRSGRVCNGRLREWLDGSLACGIGNLWLGIFGKGEVFCLFGNHPWLCVLGSI